MLLTSKFCCQKLDMNIILILLSQVLHLRITSAIKSEFSSTSAMKYLSQYGYLSPLNPANGGIISEQTMHQAIAEFQSFAGLNVTGLLNNETVILMSMPRCGVKDKISISSQSRLKRYALQGSRWRVKKLTYKISKYPRSLEKDAVDREILKAFSIWSDYTDLTFTSKKTGQVHIDIRFEHGEHGDGDPFDGPGGTLAHAYFPVYGGDAHFDDSEHWTINSFRGTNLFQVAAHEFGHSLGLSHSDVKSALMAPFYRGYDPDFMIDTDDIYGIQALYGSKTEGVGRDTNVQQQTTSIPLTGEEDSQLCLDSQIDAIFNSIEGYIYVFKGNYYWKLTSNGVESGYPRSISMSWKGLPGNIDAAFTYRNGKTYFFKGSKYWRFIGKRIDGDYPKYISEGFTGVPDNIDAATVWTGNGKIYFYKGTKFWRFDPLQKPPVNSTYPKPIANWKGIPDNVDGAFNYHGNTYFFKDKLYYRFNDKLFSVDIATPTYPRSIAYWWFGCRSTTKRTLNNIQWLTEKTEKNSTFLGHSKEFLTETTKNINIHSNNDDIILDAIT